MADGVRVHEAMDLSQINQKIKAEREAAESETDALRMIVQCQQALVGVTGVRLALAVAALASGQWNLAGTLYTGQLTESLELCTRAHAALSAIKIDDEESMRATRDLITMLEVFVGQSPEGLLAEIKAGNVP